MRLATGVAAKFCFQHADGDDAQGEALLAAVKAIRKFHVKRGNAFGYFTRIMQNAMSKHRQRVMRVMHQESAAENHGATIAQPAD